SMNIGIQRKFFNKRFIVTVNAVDPIFNQENRSFTYGPDFNLESFNTTNSRNYRLTVGYNFIRGAGNKEKLKALTNT
ncbi:MAG: outer membrane beta-barrel protein, partial [Flavitalea sp.]